MRKLWVTLLSGLVLVGCQHPGAQPAGSPNARKKPAGAQTAAPNAPATFPQVTPINELRGKVRSVHATMPFLVIDFGVGSLPPVGQVMSVYRQGLKVGQVKISGPAQDHNIVADIVAGNAREGDDVRND